jgi:DNA-binding CsgD family transcriptional regulator
MQRSATPNVETSHGPGSPQGGLVGRDAEIARLLDLIDSATTGSHALVLLGEAGMGKTTLLGMIADRARSIGMYVLSATGHESEQYLHFAFLHALLRPVLPRVRDLAERQANALLGALGLAEGPTDTDELLTRIAALTLLSDVAEESAVLLVIDDSHWVDQSSLDLLSFIGNRLDSERVRMLFGARASELRPGFDRTFPELELSPLSPRDADLLLDRQENPPLGNVRAQLLAESAGNPMAVIELAKAVSADPGTIRRWASEPLPPGDRLGSVLVTRVRSLPESTRAMLLLAAVADGSDLSEDGAVAATGIDPERAKPAERLGLIKLEKTGLTFSHPLVRSVVYHDAPFAERAEAHRRLADRLRDAPDRRAWHLAAAVIGPHDEVASMLEETASQALRRGGAVAAAAALESAAVLSSDPGEQARRYLAAASAAIPSGQTDWVQSLGDRALVLTSDPWLQLQARATIGWALAWSADQAEALAVLTSAAEDAVSLNPVLGWEALGFALTVQFTMVGRAGRKRLQQILNRIDRVDLGPCTPAQTRVAAAQRLYVRAQLAGVERAEVLRELRRGSENSPLENDEMMALATTAWMLDESELAVRMYQELLHRLRSSVRGVSTNSKSALQWALVDVGRWDDALREAAEVEDLSLAYNMALTATGADLTFALVNAYRGDVDGSRERVRRSVMRVDMTEVGNAAARAKHALGLAALAEGNSGGAFGELSGLFGDDGAPLHFYWSYYGIADLATAAIRAGRRIEGLRILDQAVGHFEMEPSPRVAQLLGRARGLLGDAGEGNVHYESALSDPAGEQWPFERAQLRLDYGGSLRRQKRKREAKENLVSALTIFERLGAKPWTRSARSELEACGVTIQSSSDVLLELTPQERRIVRLAAQGLTNRQIADQLLLSPRTVGSHLYRSFPKLGVSDRHELVNVLPVDEGEYVY